MDTSTITTRKADRAAEAVWRRLTEGITADWLNDVRDTRAEGDDYSTTLDIWSAALTAELQNPAHKEDAAVVLTRLTKLWSE